MDTYTIPACVKNYVQKQGYTDLPYGDMESYIENWSAWIRADTDFYSYEAKKADGRRYKVHRRSMRPANRMCREWASLLLNDETFVQCEEQTCNDWLKDYYDQINFKAHGQGLIQKAFGVGTGGWALWFDLSRGKMQVRRYGANQLIPLSWDDDGVSECAFCSQFTFMGKTYDQVQMHVLIGDTYHIKTAVFTRGGKEVFLDGVMSDFDTLCKTPTFAIVRPAIENVFVELSPYGQSVFAEAIDQIMGVDLAYDAFINEVDLSKMRLFLSDILFDVVDKNGEKNAVPFGEDDNVLFRKVATEDGITAFAPALRTDSQIKVFRTALQMLGDATGFGLTYFDVDDSGGVKTATEVSSDNSALMRNIRKHENLLEGAIAQISHAVLSCARSHLGVSLPEEGEITVQFDDSIITDTAAEKAQDQSEVDVTMNRWEYRVKWYGEDEETAKANVPGVQQQTEPPSFIEEEPEGDELLEGDGE